jgi:hypothetical protein
MATTTYNTPPPSAPELDPNDPGDFPAFAQAYSRSAPPLPPFSQPSPSAPPQDFEPSPASPPPAPAPNVNPPFSRSASSPLFNIENFKDNLDSFSLALFKNQFKFILEQQKKQMNALENQKCNKDCQDANNTTEKNTVNQFLSENTNTIFNK